jgi:hypothetical protein
MLIKYFLPLIFFIVFVPMFWTAIPRQVVTVLWAMTALLVAVTFRMEYVGVAGSCIDAAFCSVVWEIFLTPWAISLLAFSLYDVCASPAGLLGSDGPAGKTQTLPAESP